MKTRRSLVLSAAVGMVLILVPALLTTAVAPARLEPVSTGTSGRLPSVANVHERINDLRLSPGGVEVGPAKPDAASQARVDRSYGKLPLTFEANHGQTDGRVKFLSRGRGYTLFLTSTEAVFVFTKSVPRAKPPKFRLVKPELAESQSLSRTVVRMKLVGANHDPQVGDSKSCRERLTTSSARIRSGGARMSPPMPESSTLMSIRA